MDLISVLKQMKQRLTEIKGETNNSTSVKAVSIIAKTATENQH